MAIDRMIPKHERDYGTLADFHTLIDSAHARGIKVVIDFVMNHSSEFHPWFVNSASSSNSTYRNWYTWRDTNPGYLGPWGQPVWHPRNDAYYFGLFWSGMPDLNYANEAVKNEMFDFARRTNNATIIVLHNFLNQSLSNPALTLAASRLSAGTHAVLEILSEKTVGTVLIDNAGGFTNWRPAVDLPAQGTAILRIDAATTSVETTRGAQVPQYELNQNYPNPLDPLTI